MACLTEIPFVQEKHQETAPSFTGPAERRSKLRFPLDLQVRYRTLGREPLSGEGRALNVSSGGMLIARSHELSVGARVEVRIEWPWLLERRVGLQLVAVGKVVRSGPSNFAVLFRKHQFRTAGNRIRADVGGVGGAEQQTVKKAASD